LPAIHNDIQHPDYRRQGISRKSWSVFLKKAPRCDMILYASYGQELFYCTSVFRKMKAGMAEFPDLKRTVAIGLN
jgi:hypothetical protein